MPDLRFIGDEIYVDGQIVGIVVPHARPGPRDDFEQLLRGIERGEYDYPDETQANPFDELEAALDKLQLYGGMVPMASVLTALKTAKENA